MQRYAKYLDCLIKRPFIETNGGMITNLSYSSQRLRATRRSGYANLILIYVQNK